MAVDITKASEPGCNDWDLVFTDLHLRKRLVACAYRLLPDGEKHLAEDIVNEACLRSFNHTYVGAKPQYLKQVVRNLCLDVIKDSTRPSPADMIWLDAPPIRDSESCHEIEAPETDAQMRIEINGQTCELMRRLASHCDDLTKHELKILACHLNGYSAAEMASALGEDVSSIKHDRNALMAKLRYRVLHSKGRRKSRCKKDIESANQSPTKLANKK